MAKTNAHTATRSPVRQYSLLVGTAAGIALVVWLLVGMPGVPIDDGTYACGAYTTTVAGGDVISVESEAASAQDVVTWHGAHRGGDHRFTMTGEHADGSSTQLECLAL